MNKQGSPGDPVGSGIRPYSVVGLGTIVVDHMVVVDRFPERDTKNEVAEHWFQVGGPVPTALTAAARLGARAAFRGKWAKDHLGALIEEDLRREGVAFDPPACEADSQTGFAHVWVEPDSGRRTSVFHRGSHEIGEGEIDGATVVGFDALHLDGWSMGASIKAAKAMRSRGRTVFLDFGSPRRRLEELLAVVDVANCPLQCVERVFGETDPVVGARRMLESGPRLVTVTDGASGAWLVSREGDWHRPAFPIDAVDTNGAGDTFCGALIHAVMQAWAPERILAFACAAAALKCRRRGNRAALPTVGEVETFLARKAG